jgi:hypothetical protein
MRLFHFSEDPRIAAFAPRAVETPSRRPAGREWLNGPLVWAIDETHQPMYLFPRDCPRILVWPTAETTPADRALWFGNRPDGVIAHIERAWLGRLTGARLYRYELSPASFEDLQDAGMWVSRSAAAVLRVDVFDDLPAALQRLGVELRVVESLPPLRGVWKSSLHASGLRLRNAHGWASDHAPGPSFKTRSS